MSCYMVLQWKLINFSEDLYFWLQNTWRTLLKHLIPDSSKSRLFHVTTSNSGNFKVLCNISLTDFIPFASNSLISLKSMVLRQVSYLILISSKPSISEITISKMRDLQWKLINFHKDLYFWLQNTWRALLKHTHSISTESSYQIPSKSRLSSLPLRTQGTSR